MTTTVLLDFDNAYPPSGPELTPELVTHDLSVIILLLADAGLTAEGVDIRVYGGWRESGAVSRRASDALKALPITRFFPMPDPTDRALIRGSIALAEALAVHPRFDLGDTYVRRSAPPQVRLQHSVPPGCALSADVCPARILRAFTQRGQRVCPAPACSVTSREAFVTHDQKMVDTLMACDLIELARDATPDTDSIAVVTADRDVIPPVVAAADSYTTRIAVLDPGAQWQADDVRVVETAGALYLTVHS